MRYGFIIEVESLDEATLLGMRMEQAGYKMLASQIIRDNRYRGRILDMVSVEAVTPTAVPDAAQSLP